MKINLDSPLDDYRGKYLRGSFLDSRQFSSDEEFEAFLNGPDATPAMKRLLVCAAPGESSRLTLVPASVGRLRELRILEVASSRADPLVLPSAIGQLSKLEFLSLGANSLRNVEVIGSCTTLKALALTALRQIDSSVLGAIVKLKKLLYLRIVAAPGASAWDFPEEIGSLTRLRTLEVKGGLRNIPKSLGNLSSLEILDLGDQVSEVPDGLTGLSKLRHLGLTGRFKLVPSGLRDLPLLESLRLSSGKTLVEVSNQVYRNPLSKLGRQRAFDQFESEIRETRA